MKQLTAGVMMLVLAFISNEFTSVYAQHFPLKRSRPAGPITVRSFDFLNATYDAACAERKVKVRNGVYTPENLGAGFSFEVLVSYGDLTADQIEEVVVVTQCAGAVQNLSGGTIYALRGGRLVTVVKLEEGSKNDGDILRATIKDGRLIVTRGPSPNRCPRSDVAQEMRRYRLRGRRLIQIGKPICKAF